MSSRKKLQMDRAKTIILVTTILTISLTVFSVTASRALLAQRSYQSRVISEQNQAVKQLRENAKAVDQLVASYKQFIEQPTNVIGGSSSGLGERDGDNARIILDALPSKYDFPALATSLEKILTDRNFKIDSLSGVDDEIAQGANTSSNTPSPVEIPFMFSVSSSYDALAGLVDVLQRSIRPFNIQTISLSGNNNSMKMDISALTYYLPEKQLNFPTKEVK